MSSPAPQNKYVVAIAGATGNLGKEITHVFLTEYNKFFARVLALVRDPTSPGAQALALQGAEVHAVDESNPGVSLGMALQGVNIVVNALPGSAGELRATVFEASLKNGVEVYFLSEFGTDHHSTNFPGFEHAEFRSKAELAHRARKLAQGKVRSYRRTPDSLWRIAWRLSTIGAPTQRITFISKSDISRALAELALLALNPSTSQSVPDELHMAALLVLMGEGILDLSKNNINELINPGEGKWKWKTVEDHIREILNE
ncbi:hypothetical protein A0H81_14542 [Grifola frondosa]|uniref:NmrA-like domain-containing protein n=1 Tax=Grifola frondosa TaxID=5627 RepID=A0A1C7LN50_GRIFR|nr:hypothetical protein A0H81_14542 [Grifola frondosa]